MNIRDCIETYINKQDIRTPIYADDIYIYVKRKMSDVNRALFNTYLQRYEKADPLFERYQKGIYYKTVETPFGKAHMDMVELIKRNYMVHNNDIIGYESGPSYMNKIGLTTQLPNMTYIATSNTRYTTKDENAGICFVKPVAQINTENYRYLQFLDVLDNKMNVNIEAENYIDILRQQIELYKLSFEKLIAYAAYYNNIKVYAKLSAVAKGDEQ